MQLKNLVKMFLIRLDFIKWYEFKTLLRWLRPQNDDYILDIGCGTGNYDYFISNKCKCLIGIDIKHKAIKRAKDFISRQRNCKFLVCDAHFLPFMNNTFEKIVSLCSVEHFKCDIIALHEMNRVLKNNGILVLSVDSLANDDLTSEYKEHHKQYYRVETFYTKEDLESKLKVSNFKVDRIKYLITTKISLLCLKLGLRLKADITNPLYVLLFIICYPIIIISEFIEINNKSGFFLAVKAHKQL
jgi:ubiquinone/menaquinone biosynthesis C-methylase UbiE